MDKGLTTVETRNTVRGILGKDLNLRLVPIRNVMTNEKKHIYEVIIYSELVVKKQ